MDSAICRVGTPSSATACTTDPAGAASRARTTSCAASTTWTAGQRLAPSPTYADAPRSPSDPHDLGDEAVVTRTVHGRREAQRDAVHTAFGEVHGQRLTSAARRVRSAERRDILLGDPSARAEGDPESEEERPVEPSSSSPMVWTAARSARLELAGSAKSCLFARWMTASAPAAPRRSDSGSSRSPASGSTPRVSQPLGGGRRTGESGRPGDPLPAARPRWPSRSSRRLRSRRRAW